MKKTLFIAAISLILLINIGLLAIWYGRQKIESTSRANSIEELIALNSDDDIYEFDHLSYLPDTIGNVQNLTYLKIGKNSFTRIPTTIGQLTLLREVYLGPGEIEALPEEIGNLYNLQILRVTSNQLTFLPETIGQLKSLTTLNLSGNRLTSLPTEIGHLPFLEILDLSQNQLTSLPSTIGLLSTNLKVLFLGDNLFSQAEKDKITSLLPQTIIHF
jgi:Leucine-rich repeat (LRR) protein